MKKIIVKVGTNVITGEDGLLDRSIMEAIVGQLIAVKKQKISVILVSSGSVAAGRSCMKNASGGDEGKRSVIFKRQILASVGQVKLMEAYSQLFAHAGSLCAQVLATKEDFRDRQHYLCMRNCFTELLHDDIVPVVNENDVVAIDELMFTDNDELAGLIAAMLDVDKVFILTSVDGLLDCSSNTLIKNVHNKEFEKYTSPQSGKTQFGRGGMHTKCRVAHHLSSLGITTHIVNGRTPNVILDIMGGEKIGTTFEARKKVSGVKKWISHSKGKEKGHIVVNACLEELLKNCNKARSILPVGIEKIVGHFMKGDIIEILSNENKTMGYGVAQYGSESARDKIGLRNHRPLIHYDYLFLNRVEAHD